MPLASIIPIIRIVIISFILTDSAKIIIINAPAPIHAAIASIQLPKPLRSSGEKLPEKPSTTNATPRLAPEVIPRISGPAIGFLKIVCICKPLTDNAIPAKTAVSAFGNLKFRTIVSVICPLPLENSAFHTSPAFKLTEPKKISRINNTPNTKNNNRKINNVGFGDVLFAISVKIDLFDAYLIYS